MQSVRKFVGLAAVLVAIGSAFPTQASAQNPFLVFAETSTVPYAQTAWFELSMYRPDDVSDFYILVTFSSGIAFATPPWSNATLLGEAAENCTVDESVTSGYLQLGFTCDPPLPANELDEPLVEFIVAGTVDQTFSSFSGFCLTFDTDPEDCYVAQRYIWVD